MKTTTSAAVSDERCILQTWLNERLLDPEETHREIGQFIKARIPPLASPDSLTAWQDESDRLRRRILDEVVFRGVPNEWIEWKPETVWGDTLETGEGYRIRKLRYEALPHLWIPALLYEPINPQGKLPAVLNVNGHVGPKGKAIAYEQLRCINLAKQGMLALHPEWLEFGELGDSDYKHNRSAYLDLCGLSGLSVFYLAVRGGLDVLLDQAATDAQRLAMTGLSGGGWQTIILGSLDKRLSVLAPNAGHIGLDQRVDHRSDIGDLEQNPTDLVSIADYTHLTAMLAPRPTLLIYNEKDDCCFVSERAKPSVFDPVVPFYRLFDREADFKYYENTNPGTHNYDRDNRQQFYRFIHHHFLPDAPIGEEIPSETELLNPDQLEMGLPEDNANFFTLAQRQLSSLPRNRPPTDDLPAVRKWQEKARSRLLNLLKLRPMRAKATALRRALHGELGATWYRFTVGEACTISALVVSRPSPQNTVIIFADAGRATMEGLIKEQIETGSRVIAVDPLFMGECMPKGAAPSHYTMMIGTVGERALGIQVGQIDAVVKWACQQYGVQQVYVHSSGWTAGIVALMVAGLNPDRIDWVVVQNGLPSLKRLIEDRLEYEQYPTLFCFGLLEQFDVAELVSLCFPRKVIIQ